MNALFAALALEHQLDEQFVRLDLLLVRVEEDVGTEPGAGAHLA